MSAETSTRPFQVGDRVRITDNNRRIVSPGAQYVFEGLVSGIDPASDPESGHDFGPDLWIDTEPFVRDGKTITRTFCPLTDDMTAASDPDLARSIELLEPAPTTQDHGPLAAHLSDRTLAKVLSRPAHVPSGEATPTRVFGFNVVMIDPEGNHLGPRLDGVVSRQRAQDELDELEPFMTDGWTTVMVELREVTS
jgi:hypothetical protein